MKVREDFVTNSSSSSFVLAFENKGSVEKELADNTILEYYDKGALGTYTEVLLRDIGNENNIRSVDEVLDYYRERMKNHVFWLEELALRNSGKFDSWADVNRFVTENSEEFDKKVNSDVEILVKKLEDKLQGKDYIVLVSYGDESGGTYADLEHDIVPELECCVAKISHH